MGDLSHQPEFVIGGSLTQVVNMKCDELQVVLNFYLSVSPGSHNIRGHIELVLRRAVQPAGDSVCNARCSRDLSLPSGE